MEQELQGVMEAALASSGNPGMTVQVAAPGWTFASAAGLARLAPPLRAAPAMHFRAGSISKMFTAAAVCRLAEDGRLDIDDPVGKWLGRPYLDRMANADRITPRLLLGHRSGIADCEEDALESLQMSQPDRPLPAGLAIFRGLDRGPLHMPGDGHVYSNVNYLLLGLVIDAASGSSYEQYLARTIIKPLRLAHTFVTSDPPIRALPEPYMRCLLSEGGRWTDYSTMYRVFDRAAADLVSTAGDINLFHRALMEGRIIGRTMLREVEDFLPASERYDYGLGYTRKRVGALTLLGHSGTCRGSWTNLYYCVEKDAYFAFNVNGSPSDLLTQAITDCL
jgi:D-alanyl-D-alanine carboxypeptidase